MIYKKLNENNFVQSKTRQLKLTVVVFVDDDVKDDDDDKHNNA